MYCIAWISLHRFYWLGYVHHQSCCSIDMDLGDLTCASAGGTIDQWSDSIIIILGSPYVHRCRWHWNTWKTPGSTFEGCAACTTSSGSPLVLILISRIYLYRLHSLWCTWAYNTCQLAGPWWDILQCKSIVLVEVQWVPPSPLLSILDLFESCPFCVTIGDR